MGAWAAQGMHPLVSLDVELKGVSLLWGVLGCPPIEAKVYKAGLYSWFISVCLVFCERGGI